MTEQPQVRRYAGSDAATPSTDLIPPAPPWRVFDRSAASEPDPFRTTEAMVDAVNAALTLRRPLLLTGRPGSGKSSLIESVARQLDLGPVLRWPITSRSTVDDALYRYDAMGRLYAERLNDGEPTAISDYLRLGPLGTALLPSSRPRALLIDEIDKGDIDLPNDLLNVFERGEFEIKELARLRIRARSRFSTPTAPSTRRSLRDAWSVRSFRSSFSPVTEKGNFRRPSCAGASGSGCPTPKRRN